MIQTTGTQPKTIKQAFVVTVAYYTDRKMDEFSKLSILQSIKDGYVAMIDGLPVPCNMAMTSDTYEVALTDEEIEKLKKL